MRCEDLTRELATPTGGPSSAELAGHLAACPACAEWSRSAAHFDQIWEATRPVEPPAEALDALWARASVALEFREVPGPLKFAKVPGRRRWALATFALAQAAALLIAGLVLLRGDQGQMGDIAAVDPATIEPTLFDLNAEPDVLPTVHIDKANKVTVGFDVVSDSPGSSSLPAVTPKDFFDQAETELPVSGF